jgi:hypothetical protein
MQRALVGVYARQVLIGSVWSLAVVLGALGADDEGLLHVGWTRVAGSAAVVLSCCAVRAMRQVRYVRGRNEQTEPGDYSRRPRRDLALPGLDMTHALALVRDLERDKVLRVEERAGGGFVVRASRGGIWSRATARLLVAVRPEDGVVGMRIEGGIPLMQGADDGRTFLLILQLRDHFIGELRDYLISSPLAAPEIEPEPESAGR